MVVGGTIGRSVRGGKFLGAGGWHAVFREPVTRHKQKLYLESASLPKHSTSTMTKDPEHAWIWKENILCGGPRYLKS